MQHPLRTAATAATTVTALAGLALAVPGAAQAAGGGQGERLVRTLPSGGPGVAVRSGPSTAAALRDRLPERVTVTVSCQAPGRTVTIAGRSTAWWARLPVRDGWTSTAYLAGAGSDGALRGVPRCGGSDERSAPGGSGGSGGSDLAYADLVAMFPGKVAPASEVGLGALTRQMEAGGITGPRREAAFLATLANESAFRTTARQTGTGDARWAGRGLVQLSGAANYGWAADTLGVDLRSAPHLARSERWSPRIARWYWTVARDINPLADDLDMAAVDRAVGYAPDSAEGRERCADFKRALRHLSGRWYAGVRCS